jgi:hypothetical protein
MNKTIICLAIYSVINYSAFAFCKSCNDRGYKYNEIECPLCKGFGTVSPAYYGNAIGVTRWTVTESFIGCAKIAEFESEKKYKKYTFQKCPVCNNYKKKGFIRTAEYCLNCNKNLIKNNIQSYNNFKRMLSKENQKYLTEEMKELKPEDFFWTKLSIERKNWKLDGKNKESILCQAITKNWATDLASEGR